MDVNSDSDWMRQALALAEKAERLGEVPVGALVVMEDKVLGAGFNRVIADSDPTAHAEIVALRAASRHVGNYRLPGSTIYVTLEPCSMCAGASGPGSSVARGALRRPGGGVWSARRRLQ